MAQCLDVRRERFASSDRFLLDTNVIIAICRVTPGRPTKAQEAYQEFAGRARIARATLFASVLSFFEVASAVERAVYCETHAIREPRRDEIKADRRDPARRREVLAEIEHVWTELRATATVLDASVGAADVDNLVATLGAAPLDGYDPALLFESRRHNISTIVTHDADFESVRDLIVLTANDTML